GVAERTFEDADLVQLPRGAGNQSCAVGIAILAGDVDRLDVADLVDARRDEDSKILGQLVAEPDRFQVLSSLAAGGRQALGRDDAVVLVPVLRGAYRAIHEEA